MNISNQLKDRFKFYHIRRLALYAIIIAGLQAAAVFFNHQSLHSILGAIGYVIIALRAERHMEWVVTENLPWTKMDYFVLAAMDIGYFIVTWGVSNLLLFIFPSWYVKGWHEGDTFVNLGFGLFSILITFTRAQSAWKKGRIEIGLDEAKDPDEEITESDVPRYR